MSSNHHTPYAEGTKFRPSMINPPLGQLDAAITQNAADITTLEGGLENAQENQVLIGYSTQEVTADATSGAVNLDCSLANVFKVTIGAGVDAALTFTNLPAGKSVKNVVRLEMAGVVPSSVTIQTVAVDLSGVSPAGEVLVDCLRIGETWYLTSHHAS